MQKQLFLLEEEKVPSEFSFVLFCFLFIQGLYKCVLAGTDLSLLVHSPLVFSEPRIPACPYPLLSSSSGCLNQQHLASLIVHA